MTPREEEIGELSDDAIAGTWRVLQRMRGHRYAIDDVVTAWEAVQEAPSARRVADLGCGIGSVALMLAYKLRTARIVGIEAQTVSVELACRNVARNGLGDRIAIVHGDVREPDVLARLGGEPFDLVTGTPPYFEAQRSSPSTDAQRTYARIEMRGGIEEYLRAAARLLAPGGRVVVCGDARRPERARQGARAAGLALIARRDVIPREGKDALFSVWVAARAEDAPGGLEVRPPIVARDARGVRTPMQHALRRFFDLPVPEHEAPSPRLRARRAR